MSESFLHGVEVIEIDNGPRPIRTVRSAVIGLVGTAPDADDTQFPLNTPVLVAGNRLEAAKLDTVGGKAGTLPRAIDGIFDQAGALVVVVRVEEGADDPATLSNVIGGIDPVTGLATGVHVFRDAASVIGQTPRILIAPGFTHQRTDDAVTAITVETGGTGYSEDVTVAISDAGGTGSGATAEATVEDGAITAITVTAVGRNYTTPVVTLTDNGGSGSGAAATAHVGDAANPVVAELQGLADALRAVVVADGPNTTDADAIAYRGDFGSGRVYVVDPAVLVWETASSTFVTEHASARVAGLVARVDNERGFWHSPSNKPLYGISGTSRPVDFALGDTTARANLLNEAEVATVIREDGYRLWGNRTCSDDPKWAFLSVRRTADMINESLLRAHMWAVDRNITKTYVEDVMEGVNLYLRGLQARGAILGGSIWLDQDLNTPTSIADGRIYFDFDFTPPYPAERVSFRSHLVNDYIGNIFG